MIEIYLMMAVAIITAATVGSVVKTFGRNLFKLEVHEWFGAFVARGLLVIVCGGCACMQTLYYFEAEVLKLSI